MTANLAPLAARLPPLSDYVSADDIFSRFVDYVTAKKLTLYPAQEDALLEIVSGKNIILNTPTGSGKSLVATAMIFKAMAEGKRSVYTCPIKALVNEKFFALCEDFGPENVGMLTGDAAINRDAPILCCTAEILANICLRQGHFAPVDYVVIDEFHYYSDRERGAAWQIPLLVLSSATFLLMSATLGNTDLFEKELTTLTGQPTAVIRSTKRPVPLDFEYRETPLHETLADLVKHFRHPVYLVNFTQRACAEEAQNLMSVDFCTKEEKKAISEALRDVSFDSPYGKEVQKFLKHGVGIHHAGLLPRYRLAVEKLAQAGHLKVICGTDTLGVGVNIPIRTVVFTKLCKFDGEKTALLTVRDFQQISGRAGRKGFDDQGWVVAQAPEHVIENLALEKKAGGDPAKLRRIVRRKPPERGYVHYDKSTFDRLVSSLPEPLVSRFKVTHAMVLNVLQRDGRLHDGCRALGRIIRRSHGTPVERRRHGQHAWTLFRSLIEAGVVRKVPRDDGAGLRFEVDASLQVDFSLHNTLALWLLESLPKVDPESPDHALDVLTLVECTVENPEIILQKQLDRIKTEAMADMKARGVEYEQRIEELQKLEYPKPHREFVYATFNDFAKAHPWIGEDNIRPKSVAREMFEAYHSFADYIREYDLQRSEGVLLRYLSDVYKFLVQCVPITVRTPEVYEIIVYFRAMLRDVDSSLLDEWEAMHVDPDDEFIDVTKRGAAKKPDDAPPPPKDVTANDRAFKAGIRRVMFSFIRAVANRDWQTAARVIDHREGEDAWTPVEIERAMQPYYDEHATLRVDHAARAPGNTLIDHNRDGTWRIRQVMVDPDEHNDWVVEATVDLATSRERDRAVIHLDRIGT
jgi:superfamily II RNA helicase